MKFYALLIVFFFSSALTPADNTNLDLLWEKANATYKSDPNLAFDYASELQKLAKDHDQHKYADATRLMAIIKRNQGNFTQSVKYFFEALKAYQDIDDAVKISVCYYNIAQIFKKAKDYNNALPYYRAALEYSLIAGRQDQVINRYYQIGYCHAKLQEFADAETHLNTALELAKKEDPEAVIDIINVLGMTYFDQENYATALSYYQEVDQLAKKDANLHNQGMAIHNMAQSHFELGHLAKAATLISQALEHRILEDDPDWILSSLILQTTIAHESGRALPYIETLKRGIEQVPQEGINEHLNEALHLMNVLVQDTRYQEAFPRAYMLQLIDRLDHQAALLHELTQTLEQFRNQYALQSVVEFYHLEDKNQSLQRSKTRILTISAIIFAIALLVFGISYFFQKKRKRGAYNTLIKLDQQYREQSKFFETILKDNEDLKITIQRKDETLTQAHDQMGVINDRHAQMNELYLTLIMQLGIKGKLPPKPPFDDFLDDFLDSNN